MPVIQWQGGRKVVIWPIAAGARRTVLRLFYGFACLKTHCWWPRGRSWLGHTGAAPVLLVQADNQLLAFL